MHVAVYGSLKRGFHNHQHYMDPRGFRFVGIFLSVPKFHMVSMGRYPAVVKDHEMHHIRAEVYEVLDEAYLSQIDRLEGHPNWYKRETVTFCKENHLYGSDTIVDAEMYMLSSPPDFIRYNNVRITRDVAEWVRTHD